jgi:copper(I)-binding protein
MRFGLITAIAVLGFIFNSVFMGHGNAEATSVGVHDPWVAEAPPMAKVMAAYMELENLSDRDQTLVEVTSPSFDKAEIHRTEMREGIVRMVPVEQLTVEPRSRAVFEPGGYHLMLIGPHQPLQEANTVELTLKLEGGQRISVTAPVRRARPSAERHHPH